MNDELAYIMSCEDKAGALGLLIAAAVGAERERCAKIAEMPSAFESRAADRRAEAIAAVIRSKAQ